MPRGPRRLAVNFGETTLTHYGGVYLLHRFLSRLGFKDAIARHLLIRQRNNRYSVGELVLAILYPMILGLERIETTQLLTLNGVFQYLTGFDLIRTPPRSDGFCSGWHRRRSRNYAGCTIAFCSG